MKKNLKNKRFDFEKLKLELKTIRKLLIFYTISPLFVIIFFLTTPFEFDSMKMFIYGFNFLIASFFIGFIWIKMPMSRYDKVTETILISLFGLFALWMWIPNTKELKEMIDEYHTTHNTAHKK